MICPECRSAGLKSQVYLGMRERSAMSVAPYWDEDGQYHSHNLSSSTTQYSCSNGHRWSETRRGRCWCGWSAE